jgi:8-oxo-dGTP diphosphatase
MKFDDRHDTARPYIACFSILRDGNNVAMVLRKNTGWMDGYWGLPAGKVEWFEHFTAGAVREAKEEAGVDVAMADLQFAHVAHRHAQNLQDGVFMDWVDIYFEVNKWSGTPFNAEKDKSEQLQWIDLTNMPENVVPSQRAALEHIAKGSYYSEFGWDA